MKKAFLFFLLTASLNAFTQVDLSYYLPSGLSYNPDIPTPKEILGYHPGEWHASHDQLIYYMRAIASSSDRVILKEFAKSHEGRPLMQLVITSEENHTKLDKLKEDHIKLADPKSSSLLNTAEMPIVIWLGYTIHGNEPSGANASLLIAYYLASAQGQEIEELLDNAIIILDPCYNPDGMNRFASWVNTHRSHVINTDPNDREYTEAWPRGRTNHYWFDLNRDWLPLAHPESRGRIKRFHEWKPNILTDHHEMGTNSTFFFQPGIPSRKFPWTPEKNVELTHKMARYHSKYLDKIGSLYYSEESFDDFYIGKGSTYPDVNGCVGILFEQASSRGHAQENQFGILTFPMTIRNQFTTSLSTMAAGLAYRKEFLDYQRTFYRQATNLANSDNVKAYVFGSEKDKTRNHELVKMLTQHKIAVHQLSRNLNANGHSFKKETSYIVSLDQPQYRLIKGIFETRTRFQDSLFYDVSSWTMPLAFNLPHTSLDKSFNPDLLGNEIESPKQPKGKLMGGKDAYAYAIEPYGYYSYRAASRLLKKKVIVQVLHETHTNGKRTFPRGTMIVPVGVQEEKRRTIEAIIDEIAKEDAVDVFALSTGLAVEGIDLGSRSNTKLDLPKAAVLVDGGITSYEAGEVWHLFDQRLKMKLTLLPINSVNSVSLSRYNRIIITNGALSEITDTGKEKLKDWVQNGGVIISWKQGGKWLSDNGITNVSYYKKEVVENKPYQPYADLDETRGAQITGGAIFEAKVDLTHPLSYGMTNNKIALFRNHNLVLEKSKNPYANPIVYSANPLLSGYVSKKNLEKFSDSPAVTISSLGRGKVITLADNPNFRAFWYGTNKIFMNALFFGKSIDRNAGE